MLIDRHSNPWIITCIAILVIAGIVFAIERRQTSSHPSGGSVLGLTFGFAGFAAMLGAMLLAARKQKKVRSWRLGRTYYWMQAHVWLGLISYPLILFHAGGFHWGGALTQWLMWLFTFTIVSGVVGIVLQQFMPTQLMREVPAETIAAQIPLVLEQVRAEAQIAFAKLQLERANEGEGTVAVATTLGEEGFVRERLERIRAAMGLADEGARSVDNGVGAALDDLRGRLPMDVHPTLNQLRALANECRQLRRQQRLQWWLSSWLMIHVPVSYALVVLAVIHAIKAFAFTTP